ncbi:MAG: 50S ribosomal protein L18 [Candidatus Sungbacteria bacterium]|nr:50S ribosomal protein L18 [Candidatus Sungbacteria bacterium]
MNQIKKQQLKIRRHKRIRAKIIGTKDRPRLSVFRSNKHIELQIIDDTARKTIVAMRDSELGAAKKKDSKMKRGEALGALLAKKAKEQGISSVVFDRGGYDYHGIVRAVAEGARKGELKF